MFFKHQMLDAKTAQVFAGGHSGLSCTYDERIDFYDFFCHLGIPRQVAYDLLDVMKSVETSMRGRKNPYAIRRRASSQ
ncbi:hypothetical protein ALQ57_101701 [Pseudomonas amygdali pv. hibisci]|uniref:Uncharacterized protein n=1 Tax=Pseudomonas amygdali pv. hibisci TaxID=251723 RepID=A0AB34U2G7_PSEA0|nr:hypothetical protein ALO67_101673 [Pseudomonas amygdali pv. hibisci]RMN57642.1 hypothetical protein ALQ57_101701 [Pseudomonas amygdali pv. hibisci]